LNTTNRDTTKSSIDGHAPTVNMRRMNSLVAGAFYLLTFVSIPTLALYAPARDPNFIVGPGPDGGILRCENVELARRVEQLAAPQSG